MSGPANPRLETCGNGALSAPALEAHPSFVQSDENGGLKGCYKYRAAAGFLYFALLGPFLGTVTFLFGLHFLPLPASASILERSASSWVPNLGMILTFSVIGTPFGYVIGFIPACIAGFLFLLLHAYGHVNHFRACLLIVAVEAILIVFIYFNPVRWGFFYRIDNPAYGALIFVTHAVPTIIASYLAWRTYSGRWLPRKRQQAAMA